MEGLLAYCNQIYRALKKTSLLKKAFLNYHSSEALTPLIKY